MKLIRHVMFVFLIFNNLPVFADEAGGRLKNKSLLYYTMNSGNAWRTCDHFLIDREAIHAVCRTDCFHKTGILAKCVGHYDVKETSISMKAVATAKKHKHKIENINGVFKIRK